MWVTLKLDTTKIRLVWLTTYKKYGRFWFYGSISHDFQIDEPSYFLFSLKCPSRCANILFKILDGRMYERTDVVPDAKCIDENKIWIRVEWNTPKKNYLSLSYSRADDFCFYDLTASFFFEFVWLLSSSSSSALLASFFLEFVSSSGFFLRWLRGVRSGRVENFPRLHQMISASKCTFQSRARL